MHKPTPSTNVNASGFPERLLACAVGRARAAGIYGDLLELLPTRGRIWFFAAYIRTLLFLTWRVVLAFLSGLVSVRVIFWILVEYLHVLSIPSTPRTPLTKFIEIFLTSAAAINWFTLPFFAIRFGKRDRLTLLSAALFLSTLPGFFRQLPHFSLLVDAAGIATLTILTASLCSKEWRNAGLILATTIGTGIGASVIFFKILDTAYHFAGKIHPHVNNSAVRMTFAELTASLAMLVVAAVCSRMHDRLFRPSITGETPA